MRIPMRRHMELICFMCSWIWNLNVAGNNSEDKAIGATYLTKYFSM